MYNSYLEIDFTKIKDACEKVQRQIGPKQQMLPVLKANAYGIGALKMAEFLVQTIGVRALATWKSGSTVVGGPVAGGGTASDLRFSDQMTVNLRVFANLGQLTRVPVLRNAQARISVNNLFNDTQEVRDNSGTVPLRYQAGYLNPQGRYVELSIQKQF